MSGLAQIIRAQGNIVSGSDRNYDAQKDQGLFSLLQSQGIRLFPQDGSGIGLTIDAVIFSGAIEPDNPDLKKTEELSLPVMSRSECLAQLFNSSQGIGVAGSSGKSTITAMAAKIMDEAALDPTVINGAIITDYEDLNGAGNAKLGSSEYMLVETDESDGSLVNFYPEIGILANISKDHKPIPELIKIFSRFLGNTKKTTVINADCPFSRGLAAEVDSEKVVTFGYDPKSNIRAEAVELSKHASSFMVEETPFFIKVPGKHNISNALAAIALGVTLEIPLSTMSRALSTFRGVKRRLELVGEAKGVLVYDDFSHNPAKITAALETVRQMGSRVILLYQPHGYGPTKLLQEELVKTFNDRLTPADILILLDIYYAGGTADRSVSSGDLLREVRVPLAEHVRDRKDVIRRIDEKSKPGDVIVVMGARDNTLSELAKDIVQCLKGKERSQQETTCSVTQ